MRRMDPDFAEAFSKEYPEAYSEAVRSKRRRDSALRNDHATAVHVPLFPRLLTRLFAGVLILGLLGGSALLVTHHIKANGVGIPSGQQMTSGSSSGSSQSTGSKAVETLSDPDNGLGDKIKPLGDAGKNFLQKWTR